MGESRDYKVTVFGDLLGSQILDGDVADASVNGVDVRELLACKAPRCQMDELDLVMTEKSPYRFGTDISCASYNTYFNLIHIYNLSRIAYDLYKILHKYTKVNRKPHKN